MSIDPMTIVFGFIALVVIWKLRSVLGEKTGLEKPPRDMFVKRTSAAGSSQPVGQNVVRLPTASRPAAADQNRWRPHAEPDTPLAAGLDAIAAADPGFSIVPFLDGGKKAYEMIVTAFAAGDRTILQRLLANDVYDSFNAALIDREKRGETVSTTFVSNGEARIESAQAEGRTARVAVRFLSKQISATHGPDGQLVDGSVDQIVEMNDVWTFARDTDTRDPNWKLVATESGH